MMYETICDRITSDGWTTYKVQMERDHWVPVWTITGWVRMDDGTTALLWGSLSEHDELVLEYQ